MSDEVVNPVVQIVNPSAGPLPLVVIPPLTITVNVSTNVT